MRKKSERIVIDKSQKGGVEEAQRVAAEQIALGRVERERHIESTQERSNRCAIWSRKKLLEL